jgi:hypothetical protein
MADKLRYLTLLEMPAAVRSETWNERPYTVVPVVALVEGVIHAVNSKVPELVKAERLLECAAAWENQPLFAGHPMRNGTQVSGKLPDVLAESFGVTRFPRVDGKRLCMEAWIDDERANRTPAGARVLERVKAQPPKMVEVSVGTFVHAAQGEGNYNGKRFAAEWTRMVPDHLALLDDGQRGACSISMGCGTPRMAMRVAADGSLEDAVVVDEQRERYAEAFNFLRTAMPRGWTNTDVSEALREALVKVEGGTGSNLDIVNFTDKRIIYVRYPESSAYLTNEPWKPAYFGRDYTIADNAAILGEREQVEPVMTYPALNTLQESASQLKAACGCGGHKPEQAASAAQGDIMDKARIAALAANPHSAIKDIKVLEATTEEGIAALETQAAALKTASENNAIALKAAQDKTVELELKLKAAETAPITEDRLPADIRAIVEEGRVRAAAEKNALVASLKTAAEGILTEAELSAKSLDELKQLARFAKVVPATAAAPVADYSAQGTPRLAQAGDDLSAYKAPDAYAKTH